MLHTEVPFYKRILSHERHFDFKLPAARVLGSVLKDTPESPIDLLFMGTEPTFKVSTFITVR